MFIEFPLNKKLTALGEVCDPVIGIEVLTKNGFRPFEFILDSGADCTVLPRYMATLTGIDLSTCKQDHTYGLENRPLKVYISNLVIKISTFEFSIRCLFTEDDSSSLLLGRMDIYSHFNITFDNKNKRIRLTKI